jgi:hypothetical protein
MLGCHVEDFATIRVRPRSDPSCRRASAGTWVDELRRICAEAVSRNTAGTPQLVLDLAGVSFLDANGIALLRQLVTGRVSITNYSMFIAEQLKEVSDVDR